MKKVLSLFLFLSCMAPLHAQTTLADSIMSDGVWRKYLVYVPANFNAAIARPLILNMHGLGSNDTEQLFYSNFMPIADTAGFLMAYPQGLSSQGSTYWNVGIPLTPNTNDLKFLSSLIDTLSHRYKIDAQRVYATGMSMGGYMSHYLALNLNNRIAAIASVTGTIYPAVYAAAHPGRAVPVMQMHGTADPTVPYAGNFTGIPIDTLVRFWVDNNHCNPVPAHTSLPDVNTSDGCTADHYVYSGGLNGATVEFYRINGGQHTWPGSPYIIGITNEDFNASAEIWRFFRQYRLAQFTRIEEAGIPDFEISPNPCKARIQIHTSLSGKTTISDMAGRQVLVTAEKNIDISRLPPGVYMLLFEAGESRVIRKVVKE